MIEKFDVKKEKVEICIIPELKVYMEHSLSRGDTIVCFIDMDKYNLDDQQHFYKLITAVFPDNQVLILPKGTEIGVIKNDVKCY